MESILINRDWVNRLASQFWLLGISDTASYSACGRGCVQPLYTILLHMKRLDLYAGRSNIGFYHCGTRVGIP